MALQRLAPSIATMLSKCLWLLHFSLLCSEGWVLGHASEDLVATRRAGELCGEGCPMWGHADKDTLERRLAGDAPVLVACKLTSVLFSLDRAPMRS